MSSCVRYEDIRQNPADNVDPGVADAWLGTIYARAPYLGKADDVGRRAADATHRHI